MSREATVASAPAKVNLVLLAGAEDAEGYHPLSTVFEAVSLREYVSLEPAEETTVRTIGYRPGAAGEEPLFDALLTRRLRELDGREHLALKALRAVAPRGSGARVTVHKTVPVAGGMAGGSADAAAALVAANRFFGLALTDAELLEVGAKLGADVPACISGGISLGLGRGDRMRRLEPGTRLPTSASQWWVAVEAKEGLSTPRVFQEFDRLALHGAESRGDSVPGESLDQDLIAALTRRPLDGAVLVNELEPAAFSLRPELGVTAKALRRAGASAALLSGSGPTMLGLTSGPQEAQNLSHLVTQLPWVRRATAIWGPAVGAELETALPGWTHR